MTQLRPATPDDLPYLTELLSRPEVHPFLAHRGQERLGEMLAQGQMAGAPFGLYVVEANGGEPVGGLALELISPHSRLCNLRQLMIDPSARGAGIGTAAVRLACHRVLVEHGHHRVQTESYGDNHAVHRLFERVGFVREGVRRSAYWRGGDWVDGVIHGILTDEFE